MKRLDVNYDVLASSARMDSIVYVLVTNKYATLKEIRDDYSIDEVLDLYEACMVNAYNRTELIDQSKEKAR